MTTNTNDQPTGVVPALAGARRPRAAVSKAKRAKRACSACGRVVAVRSALQNDGGGKHMVPHKCPHGRPCIAGDKFSNNGWNPGSGRHVLTCRECAANVKRGRSDG